MSQQNGSALRLLAAVVAAQAGALVGLEASPILIGALMDHLALSEAYAGGLASGELCALAIAAVASAGAMARHSRARVAIVGAIIALSGHLASAFVSEYPLLLAARIVAGLGEGVAFAAGAAAAAGTRAPDRLFAGVAIIGGLGGVALLAGLPFLTVHHGPAAAYAVLAAMTCVALPFVCWLPAPAARTPGDGSDSLPHRGQGLCALAALAIISIGEGAVWAFTAKIAENVGLPPVHAGQVLAVSALIGLLGGGLAAWLGTRLGRVLPVCAGLSILTIAVVILVTTSSPLVFSVVLGIWAFMFFFSFPYLMGTLAVLDPRGRWTVIGGAAELIGLGVGPFIGGILVTGARYELLAWYMVVACVVSLAFMFPVLRFADALSSGIAASGAADSSGSDVP